MDAILETFGALLRIAQIERGVTTDRFAEVDLSTLLATVAELYEPMADEKGQHFAIDVAPGLIVWGDRELLAQMVANVVENAMKHSPEGAAIGLTAAVRTAGIEIVVADNGPGIPEAERDRVFTRFYRLESSRSTSGSGLGLSLVQAIAAQHRATIDLSDNRPGLRFRIRFAAIGSYPGEPRSSPRAASLQGFHYRSV
jgi:signal transduction histidine kinase